MSNQDIKNILPLSLPPKYTYPTLASLAKRESSSPGPLSTTPHGLVIKKSSLSSSNKKGPGGLGNVWQWDGLYGQSFSRDLFKALCADLPPIRSHRSQHSLHLFQDRILFSRTPFTSFTINTSQNAKQLANGHSARSKLRFKVRSTLLQSQRAFLNVLQYFLGKRNHLKNVSKWHFPPIDHEKRNYASHQASSSL